MQAVEFNAKIKNGMIEIPAKYKNELQERVKVILLTEEKQQTSNMIDQLLDSPLKIDSFTPLKREAVYE